MPPEFLNREPPSPLEILKSRPWYRYGYFLESPILSLLCWFQSILFNARHELMFGHVFETYNIESHLLNHFSCWYGYTSLWITKKSCSPKQRNNGIKCSRCPLIHQSTKEIFTIYFWMLANFHTACIMNILLTHFFYTPKSKMAAYPVKLGLGASKHGIEGCLLIFAVLLNAVRRFRKCFKQLCTRM